MDLDTADLLVRRVLDEVRASEAYMWSVISDRLARGQTLDPTGWAMAKHDELRLLRRDLERVVARLANGISDGVPDMLADAYRRGWAAGAIPGEPVSAGFGISRIRMETLAMETMRLLDPIGPQILRSAEDVYRETIVRTVGKVVSGAQTLDNALNETITRFAGKGVGGFVDRAGRSWALDAYADMALRSAVIRTSAEGTMDRVEARGDDLVVVSDSPEECPLCRPWERKVLSISGSRGRPSVDEATSAGLFHPNCTHSLAPYVEGLTRVGRAKANPDGYEERQQQRYLERNIRSWQRRQLASTSPDGRRYASRKVREWQGRHREFLSETGRRRGRRASIPSAERRLAGR